MGSFRKRVIATAIGAIVYGGAAGLAQANLITNGDFEANFTGWTTSGTVAIATTANVHAFGGVGSFPTGDKIVDFGGGEGPPDGLIAQTIIGTSAGTSYGVGFDYGTFSTGSGSQAITLTIRDVGTSAILLTLLVTDPTATNNLAVIFDRYTSHFTAIGASTSLSFANASVTTSSIDGFLDNVNVAVPLPGTLLLLALGLAGLGYGRRKKA